MRRLIEKPISVFFITTVLVIAGIICVNSLSTSMYPQISKPVIRAWINANGVTSEELFKTYERDIQEAIGKIEDKQEHEVEYNSGSVSVRIDFGFNKDRELAKQETVLAFESFKAKLPLDMQRSMWIGYWDNGQGMFAAGVSSTDTEKSFREIYSKVRPAIEDRIYAVKEIDRDGTGISNFDRKEVVVEFDELKLIKYGLFLPKVIGNLRQESGNFSAGKIVSGGKSIFIRTIAEKKSIDDLKKIIVSVKNKKENNQLQNIVRLEDIANVTLEKIPPRRIWRVNNRPSMMIFAKAKPGGNLLEMSEGVKAAIEKAKSEILGDDIFYEVFLDPSKYIRDAISNMVGSALVGTLIATLIILLFFGQLRSTLLIAISIPTSIITSFIFMKLFNVNINMISLGGMALAVGMIVDSSIVVLENIFRRLREELPKTIEEKITVIGSASKEVGLPVVVSTLTSVIVFLPLSQTAAMTHAILGDMSKVVVFALIISIASSLLLLPPLARYLARFDSNEFRVSKAWNRFSQSIADRAYKNTILLCTQNRRTATAVTLTVFTLAMTATFFLASSIKKEIIAEPDPSIFNLNFEAKFIDDREELFAALEPFEKILIGEKYKNRSHIISRANRSNRGNIFVLAKDGIDIQGLEKDLEEDFKSTPDFEIKINPWNPTSLPLPEVQDLLVEIRPTEPQFYFDAIAYCNDLSKLIKEKTKKGIGSWCNPWMSQPNEIQISPEKSKLARLMETTGQRLSASDIARLVKVATNEQHLGEVFIENKKVDILARFPKESVSSLEKVKNLLLSLGSDKNGNPLVYNLATVAEVNMSTGRSRLLERNDKQSVILQGHLRKSYPGSQKDFQKIVAESIREMSDRQPHAKALATQLNPYRDVDESVNSLILAMAISLVLILSLLVVQFHSIRQALIVMAAIPLGVFGVVLSLFLFKSTISLNSMLGIILLSGIAVNNSILLMDFYNRIKQKTDDVRTAIVEAVKIRFRPIMMTMMTTILAMLPIALNLGTGGKTLQPLGVAISGGLLMSTILTLLVVPLLIFIFEEKKTS